MIRAGEYLTLPTNTNEQSNDDAPLNASVSGDGESGGIDWGIEVEGSGESGAGTGAAIDWDITVEPTTDANTAPSTGGIDWGDEATDATAGTSGISWDIESTDTDVTLTAASAAVSTDPSSSSPSSSSTSSSSLLSDSVRHAFLDECQELESFLSIRLSELTTSDDLSTAIFQGQSVPHILTLQSQQTTQTYIHAVRECLQALREPRLTQLIMIRNSKR